MTKKAFAEYQLLLEHEKMLGIVSYKDKATQKTESKEEKKPVFNLKGAAAPIQFQIPRSNSSSQQ